MVNDDGVGTKLWIEDHESHTNPVSVTHTHYQSKKYHFPKKQTKIIEDFLKKNHLRWEALIHMTWGLLLNRLSTSDFITYGTATLISTNIDILKIQQPITTFKSDINEKTTLTNILSKLSAKIQKKPNSKQKIPSEIRYLLAFKPTTKKHTKTESVYLDRFPLVLCADKKNISILTLLYNPALFPNNNIDSIFDHLAVLIDEICSDIHQRAITLNILTDAEKEKILSQWNKPTYNYHFPLLKGCFHELVSEHAKEIPHQLAINHNNNNVNYKELDEASTRLAFHLIKKGVKPGDRVSIFMDRTPTWIMAMLAVFKTGAVYVPINPKFPDERINFVLEDSEAKYILVNDPTRLSEKYHTKMITIDQLWYTFDDTTEEVQKLPNVDPEQVAYIIYTSGTTGKQKGVMIKHKSLVNLVTWYQGCFKVNPKDHASQFASQGFDSHLCEIIPFLGSGASVHIVDDGIKLIPSLFFEWLITNKITVCDLPTAYAQILLSMPWPEQISLRLMKIGGESVTRYPTHTLPFDIWNGYGPTETTVEATYFKLATANVPHQAAVHRAAPPIGKPIVNYEAYVVDKYLQPVPIGVAGELLIGGVGVSAGYLNRDELTSEKFIQNKFNNESTNKLYRTGDLARWLPDGNLEFVGRIDNQVKIRGYRIELSDIENALNQHPDVNEAVVLIKESVNHEKTLIAYVVPDLERGRYLYQERCLLSVNTNKFIETITEDISKGGIALTGVSEKIPVGKVVQMHLKLPGFNEAKLLSGRLIWQIENRCGIVIDMPNDDMKIIAKSIDFYLSTRNVMEMVLSASAKRNLRKSLRNKLPEYMIPNVIVTLMQFPLTFSGKIDVKSLPSPQEYEEILHNEYIAPKSETEKKIAAMWCELLHKDKISMSDNFFDLGGSSLTAADLSVRILNQFKTPIPAKILFDLSYVPILAEYIDSNGARYSKESIIQDNIQNDCILPEDIFPRKNLIPTVNCPQNILLTGAGGFLGIYFLREILATTQAKVYCLIRKGEFDTAAKRLIATIQKFNLSDEISLTDRRIIAIASDISYDNFGLPLEQYNSLLDKIDLIYHCGAQVNIMASYNKLRGSNVQGTLEIIKFATKHFDKPIHYISTLSSAYLKDADGWLAEVFPDENYSDLFGGYAISKWVSERLLTEAKHRGLPVSIYRSGFISGQTENGITNLNDALFMLIKGCIQMGFAPEMEEKITILPVDYVSKAIIQISLAHPTKSVVYHIDHPTGIMWSDLVAWLNDYGYRVKTIPMKQWQEKLINIPLDNALFAFLPYYLALPEEYRSPNVRVDNATAELKQLKLPYPDIDDKLLTTYFDYMVRVNFLPQPGQINIQDLILS